MKKVKDWVSTLPDKPRATAIFLIADVLYVMATAVVLSPVLIFKPVSFYLCGVTALAAIFVVPSVVMLVYIWLGAFKGREGQFAIASIIGTLILRESMSAYMPSALSWGVGFAITILVCAIVYMKLGEKGSKNGRNT